ncbi:SIR2 family protein [Bacterioplanoides sp.]|uniref:SIR2 family protein n=1 Tax=Bacterioplanoides sp. TaxID=2066072 RepID=UPI003B58E18E
MTLEEAIIHALRGDSVLFTGAGFSFNAENSYPELDNKIPDAREFSSHLASLVGSSGNYDLPVIGQYYVSKKGEHGLLAELSRSFTTRKVQQYHVDVASSPWRRVYTTNYDDCLEYAALQNGKKWEPITIDLAPTAAKKLCVHINGHITNLTINSLLKQIKLTHSSYSSESFSSNKWAQQLRQDMNNAKSIIFIGYSLADIDVTRILYASPELKKRTFFIVAPGADEITTSPLESYGEVHAIGIEKFAEILRNSEVPKDVSEYTFSWLKKYDSNLKPSKPEDTDCIDFLTMGVVEQSHVIWSLAEQQSKAFIRRNEVNEILRELHNGRSWFLIHSDLGNGKTILKNQLSHILSLEGYTVFWDSDFDLNRESDIRKVASEEGKVAIFIDESSDRFEVVDGLLNLNVDSITVFICVRTTLYELGENKYEEYLPSDYFPIDINRLNEDDVESFSHLLSVHGLWGERADLSKEEKKSYISVDCGGAVSKIILSIFEQSEVGKRIESAAKDTICREGDAASLVILSFLLNQIGHPPRLTLLSDILGEDAWKIVRSDDFIEAGEFVRFTNGKVKARSSVVSSYLLRRAIKPELLLANINRYVRNLASLKRDRTLHHVFTELQRYAVIEKIIDSPKKYELIIGYYQSLKDLSFCQRSALFWLQYAMARLAYGEFKEASLYFEQAKALAKGNYKETTDVNNHFARLLLDSRTNSSDYSDYFDAFIMAHQILLDQMNRNTNRHFPFRQARKYVDFISYRKKILTAEQTSRFTNCCEQVISAIEHLAGKISGSREVVQCRESMLRAIEISKASNETS